MKVIAPVLVVLSLLLSGCDEPDAASIKTICTALIGPIKYNSTKPTSLRYAGRVLVLDLKQRNQVWTRLHCPSIVGATNG